MSETDQKAHPLHATSDTARFAYRAYGLAIHSDLALPELDPEVTEEADVTIRLRPIRRPLPAPSEGVVFDFGSDEHYLAWPSVGAFLIRGAREIDIDPAPGVDEPLLRLPLLGPVLALLLHLRGLLVLHASAVAMAGRAAVFLGDKQAGKSTTAARLLSAGHRLLADDVVAIDFSGSGSARILPGFPQLKLDAGAAESASNADAVAMPPVLPGFEKRQHRLNGRFSHATARPMRIYLLAREARTEATPVPSADALTALIRFSYVTRFGRRAFSRSAAAAHLKQCATLANSVQVSRLGVPSGLDRLDEVVRLVERELGDG